MDVAATIRRDPRPARPDAAERPVFRLEPLRMCQEEILALAPAHQAETAGDPDPGGAPLPDLDAYRALDAMGWLRCYTARTSAGRLVGYQIFTVRRHLHHQHQRAIEDLAYMAPSHRGHGYVFLRLVDRDLIRGGAHRIYRSESARHPHGRLFARLGYAIHETTWSRSAQERA